MKEQVAVSSGGGTAGGGMVADQDWWCGSAWRRNKWQEKGGGS